MNLRFDLRKSCYPLPLHDRPLMLDTNIWLFTCGPFIDPRTYQFKRYSALITAVGRAGRKILICQCIVSEFVHVYLAQCWREAGLTGSSGVPLGKADRRTGQYAGFLRDIGDDLHHVLTRCTQVSDHFDGRDVDRCLKDCESGSLDFNDAMIRETCRQYGAVLVTDDADFADADIPIASANRRFFR